MSIYFYFFCCVLTPQNIIFIRFLKARCFSCCKPNTWSGELYFVQLLVKNKVFISEYEVREKPTLSTWMEGGLDYIMLQSLNIDGIRTIGSVLGQSIALDYYVRQVLSVTLPYRYQFTNSLFMLMLVLIPLRLMEWLQSSPTSIVKWRKQEHLPWKQKSFSN